MPNSIVQGSARIRTSAKPLRGSFRASSCAQHQRAIINPIQSAACENGMHDAQENLSGLGANRDHGAEQRIGLSAPGYRAVS